MSLKQIADVHLASIALGVAYAVLAIVAIVTGWVAQKGFRQQTQALGQQATQHAELLGQQQEALDRQGAAQRRDFVHRLTVYREETRIEAYIEFVGALSAARSAGRRWHRVIRDGLILRLPDDQVVMEGEFFNPKFREAVVLESHEHIIERDHFYERLDELWTARAKIQLVGTADVFDAASSVVEHYDPRQRSFPTHLLEHFDKPRERFELNPGFPLPDSSKRREDFMQKAHAQLLLLADRLEDALEGSPAPRFPA